MREELERWDSESSIGQGSGRGVSPSGSAHGGRGRPHSGNQVCKFKICHIVI